MSTPAFQHLQRMFITHLRHPGPDNQPPGFAPERLAVYAELLYNKFDESLSGCFPVLKSILEKERWRALLKAFIAEHRCQSPYYRQIPDEFVLYLQNERRANDEPPFLAELAHFEWLELVLSIAESEPATVEILTETRLLNETLRFAPVLGLFQYVWPVQDLSPTSPISDPPSAPTYILGFRDPGEHVRFIALNAMTVRFVALLQNGLNGRQALRQMHNESLNNASFPDLIGFGKDLLLELHRQGAIIGVHSGILHEEI